MLGKLKVVQHGQRTEDVLEISEGFPGGSEGKESACNARDPGSIPGLGRSHGEGNGYPIFCLENPVDRGAWQATVHGVPKSQTDYTTNSFTLQEIKGCQD